jgi:homoserine kinase type II
MDKIFILQHERPETEDRMEDVKLIGAYSSEASAQAAIERLRAQPGFRDHPDGFTIDAYEMDKEHWSEGFIVG